MQRSTSLHASSVHDVTRWARWASLTWVVPLMGGGLWRKDAEALGNRSAEQGRRIDGIDGIDGSNVNRVAILSAFAGEMAMRVRIVDVTLALPRTTDGRGCPWLPDFRAYGPRVAERRSIAVARPRWPRRMSARTELGGVWPHGEAFVSVSAQLSQEGRPPGEARAGERAARHESGRRDAHADMKTPRQGQ